MTNQRTKVALSALCVMALSASAQADGYYSFRHTDVTFDLHAPFLAPTNWIFQPPFVNCMAGGRPCSNAYLVSDPVAAGLTFDPDAEAITLVVGSQAELGSAEWYFYFSKGAFGTPGQYPEKHGSGILYVSTTGFTPAVPEPGAASLFAAGIWLLTLLGMKRRRDRRDV
jgi:hypothetical protein